MVSFYVRGASLSVLTKELASSQSSFPTLELTENRTTTRAEMNTRTQAKPTAVAIMIHAVWFSSVMTENGGEYPAGIEPLKSELDIVAGSGRSRRNRSTELHSLTVG